MSTAPTTPTPDNQRPYRIVDLNYISLYIENFQEAIAFYTQVFGAPESIAENKAIYGWRMGSTWLTVFPGKVGSSPNNNPRNAEFAIQVSTPAEVDLLHQALIDAGAKTYMPPEATTMYESMRYCCVDDPFGVRIDVYCPLGGHSA
jgi:uncharacterized glyoxalase superfamily protein PhnB